MVNPPKKGVNSIECVELYEKETEIIYGGLKKRSKLLAAKLNAIPNIKTNELEGAMYSFARVFLTKSAIDAARAKNLAPDMFYCLEALENTGLVLVPGSGFRQKEGTFHFRITNLIFKTDEFEAALDLFKTFNENFFKQYP